MRRLMVLLVVAALMAGCGGTDPDERSESGSSSTDVDPTGDERLDASFAAIEESGADVVVAVSLADGPVIVREFGALRDDGIEPVQAQVDIGSITKSVTGVLILSLVDEGLIRLDETLSEIFPSVPPDKAAITVHQLLTHTAGFTDSIGDDAEVLSREAFLERAFQTELVGPPGEQHSYSNVGFSVLAAAAEVRSGTNYDELLQQVLAETAPGAIGYGSIYDDARSVRTADGESIESASWGGHDASWNLIGNGGLVTTPESFVRFRQAVDDLLSADSLAASQTPHVAEDESGESFYGYGLVVQEVPDLGTYYWHDGGNDIFSAEWGEIPESRDVFFAAGVDSDDGDAFTAMEILREELYAR